MDLDVYIKSSTGEQTSTRVAAPNGQITVGRDEGCELRLQSKSVSRRHAVIVFGLDSMHIEDQSTNGTMAGKEILHRTTAEISFGTPIKVGNYTLTIQRTDAPTIEGSALPPGALAPPPRAVTQGYEAPTPHATPSARRAAGPPDPYQQVPPTAGMEHPSSPIETIPPMPEEVDPSRVRTAGVGSPETDSPGEASVELRREIHKALLENLDLATMSASKLDDPSLRPKVLVALRRIIEQMRQRVPDGIATDQLVGELADEALGLGPLEQFLADPAISEVMVVDANTIYVERDGRIELTGARFTDDERVRAVIERIVTPLGRRIDESSPLVDARLKDGSRVNAVIRPIALRGSCITIRKFAKTPLNLDKLYGFGALTEQMGRFLKRSVVSRKNVVISGGTGSGKTTLLNILSASIPDDERIITIEDAAELQLEQPHVVSMETRPANMEGKGEYTIRDLLRNAMRMRPDRIVVGECRGGEALDMLQAMNTGHDGSLTTTHANSPDEAIARLETLALMAGVDLPSRAIREQIAASVDLVVQQTRFADGSRKITEIAEVVGVGEDGTIDLLPIFRFVRSGTGADGAVHGSFAATGYLPSFLNDFIVTGLVREGEPYV